MSDADVALNPVVKNQDCIGKHRIETCKGFLVKKQKLLYNGILSRSESSRININFMVQDYGVDRVIHLVLRVSHLFVETAKEFEFEVDRFRNVRYLKKLVLENAKGVVFNDHVVEDHNVLCDGHKLDDHRLIHDICDDCDGVIHLVVQKFIVNVSVFDVRICENGENLKKSLDVDSRVYLRPSWLGA